MSTYLPFVGFVQFPRNPRDLTGAVCPACLVDRAGSVCATCGLDLASPLIAQLDTVSADASAALDRRLELIGRIRHDAATAAASAPALAPTAVANATTPETSPASTPAAAPAAPIPTMAPSATPPSAAPRRHLGVQVILLIVGVSLLSIGAIFFLVYAFISFGLVWRSVIIVAVTIAAIVGASLLKRRRLRATAEAISALAIVFVFLDVFAVRANELFGADTANGLLYWGIALLLAALGFIVWHRYSGLRLPNIIAFIIVAPGLALVMGGATEGAADSVRLFSSFMALALGGLIHPLTKFRTEKTLVATVGAIGLASGAVTSPFLSGEDWAGALGLAIVAAVALAQVLLVARFGYPVVLGRVAAVIGAASAASATLALRVGDIGFVAFWPIVGATIVALLLEFVARGLTSKLTSHFARIAATTAAGIGVLILLIPLIAALTPSLTLAAAVTPRWITSGGSIIPIRAENAAAILALVVVVVLVGAAWAIAGTLDERLVIVMSVAVATLLLAVPLVGVLWAAVAIWLLIATAAIVALGRARAHGWSTGVRVTLATGSLAAMTLAYFSSWASIDTWWYGSIGVIALLVASRAVTTRVAIRASSLGVAVFLAFVAISAEGFHVSERFTAGASAWLESVQFAAILAAVLIAASALLSRRVSAVETRVLFWMSVTGAVSTAVVLWWTNLDGVSADLLVLPHRPTTALIAFGVVGALVLWATLRSTADFAIERIATSVMLAPAAAWALDSLARATAMPPFVTTIAPITAALIVSAAALALALRRSSPRSALDIGVAVVAVPAVFVSLTTDVTWLVLVIAAVTALLLAISRDGLFSSTHPRKNFGWLALALGVGALWWALDDAAVDNLESFVLPVAGALLLVALLEWRGTRRRGSESAASPFITLAALLVAIVPIAIAAMAGPTVRTVIIAAACAVLLLAVSLSTRSGAVRPYLDIAALTGTTGLLIAGFGRPIVIAIAQRRDDLQVDIWAAATFTVLVIALILQGRVADARTQRLRIDAVGVIIVMAMAGITIIELSVVQIGLIGTVRASALLVLLATIHVVCQLVNRAPFTRVVGWIALGGALITAVTASVVGALDPFEWATGTVAAALLIVGAVRLRTNPEHGSWPWLAPGTLVLVIPSLLATFTDAPIWRLVGLGIVCVVAILVGALAKLQAPLIIGAVVVLIHAARTFAPQLVAVYQLTEWWVWAVVGGAIILFVAVTLEKRVRDLKSFGNRVSALR